MIENIKNNFSCSGNDCFDGLGFNKSLQSESAVWHLAYKGLSIEQNLNIIEQFYSLLEKTRPSTVIEIGTFHGGLTLLISDILFDLGLKNTIIHTYDVQHPEFTKSTLQKYNNINIHTINLFNDNYTQLNKNNQENIYNQINNTETTILICDGGSKKNEFNLLCPYLKTNDIIMAHDYAPNLDYFRSDMKNKIWNWCEIQDSDIQESLNRYNLEPFMKEEFVSVAWACFRKLRM